MSRRLLAVAFTVALLAGAGLVLAQAPPPGVPPRNPTPPVIHVPPAVLGPGQVTPGRYTVVQAGKSALLVDMATGKTWELERGSSGAAWLPLRRLDDEQAAQKWRAKVREEGAVIEKQAARQARELADLQRAADEARREPKASCGPPWACWTTPSVG